jgi:hypothetical protein
MIFFWLFLQTNNIVHNLVEQKIKNLQNCYNKLNKKLNENTIKKICIEQNWFK